MEGNAVNENISTEVNNPNQNQAQPGQENFSDKFSVIARMEKKIREEREALKRKEQEYSERDKKYSGYDELDQLLEKNPLEALKRKGWDYEKLSQFALENVTDEELDPVQRRLKETEARLAEFTSSFEEKVAAKVQELIGSKEKEYESKAHEVELKAIKTSIKNIIESNKEKYELINTHGQEAEELIFDALQAHVIEQRESGVPEDEIKMLPYSEAADRVEAYLESQLEKYLKLSKIKSKLNPQPQSTDSLIKSFQTKTITDDFTPRNALVSETEEDRVRKAIELVQKGIAV